MVRKMKIDRMFIIVIVLFVISLASVYFCNEVHKKYVKLLEEKVELEKNHSILEKQYHRLELDLNNKQNSGQCNLRSENIYVNQGINPTHIKNIIRSTLGYLGVSNIKDWERLLYLTLVAESDGGYYTRQLGKGPAKGIYQLEPETEKDILKWLKVKHVELYKKIKNLRIPVYLGIHEAEYNLAYSTAMAYMEYFRRGVNPVNSTTEDLARLHKKYYNTYLGKASVNGTLKKLALRKEKL